MTTVNIYTHSRCTTHSFFSPTPQESMLILLKYFKTAFRFSVAVSPDQKPPNLPQLFSFHGHTG